MKPIEYKDPNEMWRNSGYDPYKDVKDDDERIRRGCLHGVAFIVSIIAALAMCSLMSSCTTTKVVTVEKVKNDSIYITNHQRDSVWLHDSITISERGDTVRIEKWHTKYREKVVRDTIYKNRTEIIPQPYEVIKEVPRQLTWQQNLLMLVGFTSLILLILFIVSKIRRFIIPRIR